MGGKSLSGKPWVDLIIVSYNTRSLLKKNIESIEKYTDFPYRIWVIDNHSKDATKDLARFFPRVRWVWNQTNRGYGQACNQGFEMGQGDYVAFLNCDLLMTAHWLSPLIHRLESDESIALVGPKLLSPDGRVIGAGVIGTNANPINRGFNLPDDHHRYNFPMDCISLCGAALLAKRTLLKEKIGLFDPNYFHYFEETDLCFQARSLGYRIVYEPDSVLIHHLSKSCNNNQFLHDQFQRSKSYFELKWKEFLNDEQLYEEKPCCCTNRGERSGPLSL